MWVPNTFAQEGLKDWSKTENLKAALDFSESSEMWKAARPGCSLKVLIWNAVQSEVVHCLFHLNVTSKFAIFVCLYIFCTALLISILLRDIIGS